MKTADLIRRMAELGATAEIMALAVEAIDAAKAEHVAAAETAQLEKREKWAEAKRKQRMSTRRPRDVQRTFEDVHRTCPEDHPKVLKSNENTAQMSLGHTEVPIYSNTNTLSNNISKSSIASRSRRRSALTEDAEPSERDRAVAAKSAMTDATIDLEWQRFRAHHLAKGSLMANWGQAWVTWVTNWKSFGAKQSPAPPSSASKTTSPRNGGTYKPGLGMVYPDGTVYSMLHGRREAKHREHDSEQDEAEDDKPGPPARSHSGAAGRGFGFSEAEARPPGRL